MLVVIIQVMYVRLVEKNQGTFRGGLSGSSNKFTFFSLVPVNTLQITTKT